MLAEAKPEVRTVIGSYLDLTEDEEARILAESRERYDMIQRSCLRTARREGREEGELKGQIESKREIARKALAKGYTPEDIAELTGLDIAEIKSL
jgi:predicted transposase/invertase (TIGR01784 family)